MVVQGKFDIFSPSEESEVVLPLSGADLQEGAVLQPLGGDVSGKATPAFPAPRDGQTGYTLHVAGKGWHRLTMSFVVRWQSAGDLQEVRFGIPRLPQSGLHLTLPGTWRDVQLPQCQGEEKLDAKEKGQQTLHAQLGREKEVVVRWRQETAKPAPASLEVRELYLWDLRPANFGAMGVLNYNVSKGAVSQLRLSMPDNLEIQSVELGSQSSAGARIGTARLEVQTKNKVESRTLLVDLASPVTGKLQVVLILVPRLALDAPFVQLRLPAPLNIARQHDVMLAYRQEGWTSTDKPQSLQITGIKDHIQQFVKEWKDAGQGPLVPPTRAYSFRRTPGQPQLQVALQPIRPSIRQETVCQVHPLYTDVTVRIHAQGSKEVPVAHLQLEVPPAMVLAGVTGPGIHHFSRSDAVVHVWLSNPVVSTNVVLTGWVKNVLPQDGEKSGRFLLPRIRPLPLQPPSGTVKVQPGRDSLVTVETHGPFWARTGGLVGLQEAVLEKDFEVGPGPARAHVLAYKLSAAFYEGTFQIRPAVPRPLVRTLTMAAMTGGVFSFSTRVDCQVLREVPLAASKTVKLENQVVLTLRDWPADVRLDPLPMEVNRVYQRTGNDHTWKFSLPPAQLWPLSVTVHGQTTAKPRQEIAVPIMEVAQADYRGRYLVWSGGDVKPQVKGLQSVKDLVHIQRYWPVELNRVSADAVAWQVKDAAWQLLVKAPATSAPRAWSLLWAEHEIHDQEGRWLHQANCFISTRAAAELPIVLPEGARFQAACWGEQFVNPRLDDPRHLALHMPQDLAGQVLRLRWTFADEPFLHPRREGPTFPGAEDVAPSTTLWLPADFAAPARLAPASDLLLNRARGQMNLSSLLADSNARDKILPSQLRFFDLVRRAEYGMMILAKVRPNLDQSGTRTELQDLIGANEKLSAQKKYESIRKEAEKTHFLPEKHGSAALALPHDGLPIYRFGTDTNPLRPAGKPGLGFAVFSSQLLLIGFFALIFLSFLPRLFLALPALWPEQLLVVGSLGTMLLGFSLLGVLLLSVAVLGRLIWLGLWLWRLVNRLFTKSSRSALTS